MPSINALTNKTDQIVNRLIQLEGQVRNLDALVRLSKQAARVDTVEETDVLTYTDLATAGPAVTVVIGASGRAIVTLTAAIQAPADSTAGTGGAGVMSFAVSGATTRAAADADSLSAESQDNASGDFIVVRASAVHLIVGLTPGSNTFTAKYRAGSAFGKANFANRTIFVEPF